MGTNSSGATTPPPTFGTMLRRHRRAASLTQEELAARAGISARAIADLERGVNLTPRRDTLDLLVRALALPEPARAALEAAAKRAPFPTRSMSVQRRANLPAPLTGFIGRIEEQGMLRQALAAARLVTVTGLGGCGKTRLALRVVEDLLPDYPDGVWLADLAALADPLLVTSIVASVLGVRDAGQPGLLDSLTASLRPKSLLLVLDNCEHLADACATLVSAILRACPRVRILATSREPLGVVGEHILTLLPLALPSHAAQFHDVQRSDAVRLFGERAQAVRPGFALTPHNAAIVAALCRRLDGIPVALELAAARLSALSVEDLAARLDDGFGLLRGVNRAGPPRQQTLHATLDWSHRLLDAPERAVLRRLSVFAGGWTLDAAEAVCVCSEEPRTGVAGLLCRLVDKSLVLAEDAAGTGGERRYRLLETVREYAGEHLLASGEAAAARGQHRAWYLALAERAERRLTGPAQDRWLDLLETEHDNIRVALAWHADDADDAATRVRLAAALWRFWLRRNHRSEGRRWLTGVRAEAGTMALRARVLFGRGVLAWSLHDGSQAAGLVAKALSLYRDLQDRGGIADALGILGEIAQWNGNRIHAQQLFGQSLTLRQALGDTRGTALALRALGVLSHEGGDYARGRALIEEALSLYQRLDDGRNVGLSLYHLALIAGDQGQYERAEQLCAQSSGLFATVGDTEMLVFSHLAHGNVARDRGDLARAANLYEQAHADCRQLEEPLHALSVILFGQGRLARLRGAYDEATALLEQSRAHAVEHGPARNRARVRDEQGTVALLRGDVPRATMLYAEILAMAVAGEDWLCAVRGIEGLARVAAAKGQAGHAVRLLEHAAACRATMETPAAVGESNVPLSTLVLKLSPCLWVRTQCRVLLTRHLVQSSDKTLLDRGCQCSRDGCAIKTRQLLEHHLRAEVEPR